MTKIPEPSSGIGWNPSAVFPHIVAGIHIGPMASLPVGKFDAVLSVGARPGSEVGAVHHRHIPLSYQRLDRADLDTAVTWVLNQTRSDRIVLIRSERGLQRPGLVAGMVILWMGGSYADAVTCVRQADSQALTDFRYLKILLETDEAQRLRIQSR